MSQKKNESKFPYERYISKSEFKALKRNAALQPENAELQKAVRRGRGIEAHPKLVNHMKAMNPPRTDFATGAKLHTAKATINKRGKASKTTFNHILQDNIKRLLLIQVENLCKGRELTTDVDKLKNKILSAKPNTVLTLPFKETVVTKKGEKKFPITITFTTDMFKRNIATNIK